MKNRRFRSEDGLESVLGLSWASFRRSWGCLSGASWAPLRCSWESLGSCLGNKEPYCDPLGCFCCPSSRLFSFDLLRSRCFFISWGLFGSSLGLQGDSPTLKNRAPARTAARFLKSRRFRSEGGLQSVLGLSWASFGRSWGSLGGSREPRNHLGLLLGVIVVLLLGSSRSIFFVIIVFHLSMPLRVDFGCPR